MGRLDVRHLVHAVMLTFGAVSVQNVATYFVSAGHSTNAAWTLGAALGLALLTIAVMLTHIDQGQDKAALWWLLTAGSVLALVSGGIQYAEYAKHLEPWAAMGLGYGLPLGGEILLAFATSSYVSARKRQKIRTATEGTTERIAESVAEALSDVDVTKVRSYVERRIDSIVRAQVDVVASQLMPTPTPAPTSSLSPTSVDSSAENRAEGHKNQRFGPANLPAAQARRTEQVAEQSLERTEAIRMLLADKGPLGTSAIANHLDVHRDTARKHLQAMQKGGRLTQSGRKWQLTDDVPTDADSRR